MATLNSICLHSSRWPGRLVTWWMLSIEHSCMADCPGKSKIRLSPRSAARTITTCARGTQFTWWRLRRYTRCSIEGLDESMISITRRSLLKMAMQSLGVLGTASCLGRLSRVYAASAGEADYKALVCIFLYGGNDGNNLIVPFKTDAQGYDEYRKVRGTTLGLAQKELGLVDVAKGKEVYGLHPQLGLLREIYAQGRLAFGANVGTLIKPITKAEYQKGGPVPLNLFSHSDQQQQWQMASIPGAPHNGWAGRAADLIAV